MPPSRPSGCRAPPYLLSCPLLQAPPVAVLNHPYGALTALLLPRNPLLGDTGCEILSEALQQPGCRLRELDLSRCVWVVGGCGERGALSST